MTQILTMLHEETAHVENSSTRGAQAGATAVDDEDNDESDWIVTDRTGKRRPEARKTELDGGSSPISRLFSGVLLNRSTVNHAAARRGGARGSAGSLSRPVSVDALTRNATHVSVAEPFFILPLEINDPKVNSIESALLSLSDREEVSDYHDALTGMVSTVRRHACIDQLPPFFLLQLKRFAYDSSTEAPGGTMRKSLKLVPVRQELVIPLKLLSGEKKFSPEQRTYRLRAVIFHVGLTATSGHYTVAVRCGPGQEPHVPVSNQAAPARDTASPACTDLSSTFLYLDDTHGCLVPDGESQRLLFSTHRPLNVRTGMSFHSTACVKSGTRAELNCGIDLILLVRKEPVRQFAKGHKVSPRSGGA
ncbi:unnamed protein product [Echinostoma caproni]|uniref:ubiquitinyl hydrolase 1 n=1 Tax=Echinostoma caproni TaxID=27848 RepID=A0A3P8H3D2_9TREM|nr:unnamed protein product [Echinostoma caproni]